MRSPLPTAHPIDRRSILQLAWPVVLTNLLTTAVQWVDLFMVARLGKATVAAVGLSGFLTTLLWAVLMAVQTGTQVIVAQAYGAGNRRVIGRTVQIAVALGGVVAVLVALVFSRPGNPLLVAAFRAFDAEADVAALGADYMGIVLYALPAVVVALVGQAALRAAGDTRTPLWLTGGANLLNIVLNWMLIFGHLGAPALGVEGAAWGTAISRSIEAVAYLGLLYSNRLRVGLERRLYRFDFVLLRRLLSLGAPAAVEQLVITFGFLLYNRVIASYGTEALAAYQIGVVLLQASFMPGFGLAVAATTLVGQWVGAGDRERAREAGRRCLGIAVALMSGVGVLFLLFARPFSRLVLDEPTVTPIAVLFIRMLALCQPFQAAHFALSGALRGDGDTRAPLASAVVAMYLIRLPIAAVTAYLLAGPIVGVFVGMLGDHVIRAGMLERRWRRRFPAPTAPAAEA